MARISSVAASIPGAPYATDDDSRPMFLSLPLAFAQYLDTRTVDQKVKSPCRRLRLDRHRKMLLTPADGAEVGHLPVHARELEQALRHAHRLAKRQIEQPLGRQAELNRRVTICRATPPLACGSAVPTHVFVQPDQQGAARYQRCVVVFSVGRSVLGFCWETRAISLPCAHARPLHGPIYAAKPAGWPRYVTCLTASIFNSSGYRLPLILSP